MTNQDRQTALVMLDVRTAKTSSVCKSLSGIVQDAEYFKRAYCPWDRQVAEAVKNLNTALESARAAETILKAKREAWRGKLGD